MAKSNKKWIVLGLILAAAGAGFWQYKKTQNKPAPMELAQVERRTLRLNVTATGVIEPQNRLEIKPPINGRIEEILVQEGQNVRKGQVLAWMSSLERAALLDAARAQGPEVFQRWEKIYKPAPIVAPMNGSLIARNAENGQTLTTQDVPLVMSDQLIIKAQVDETDIGRIQLKQKARIVPDAYPNEKIEGTINHIAFEAQTVNNVTIYEVDVLPGHLPDFMRAGMTVNVIVQIDKKEDALCVPSAMISDEDDKHWVTLPPAPGEKKTRRREVEVGISDGRYTEIVSGLKEGDSVAMEIRSGDSGRGERRGQNNPFSPMGNTRRR